MGKGVVTSLYMFVIRCSREHNFTVPCKACVLYWEDLSSCSIYMGPQIVSGHSSIFLLS